MFPAGWRCAAAGWLGGSSRDWPDSFSRKVPAGSRLVDAALLLDRHHQVDEVLEALGGHDAAQIEAVDIGFLDPGDQVVGDLLGGADDGGIAAAEPHPADDAPQRP